METPTPSSRLARLASSVVVRNTGWMLAAQIVRLLAQIGYFVLIARALGVDGLGELAAALAVVFLLVPFSGVGAGNLLILNVARAPRTFPACWGYALCATTGSAVLLAAVAVFAGRLLLPDLSARLLLAIAAAELAFGKLCELAGQAFQAFERLRVTALLSLVLPTLRFAAAAGYVALASSPNAESWALAYLAASALASFLCLTVVTRWLGLPGRGRRFSLRDVRTGLAFSVSYSAALIYSDIDKLMLARLAGLEVVGIYTAAYRAASTALIPVLALLSSTYARFFAYGSRGLRATVPFAKRLLPASLAYGLVAGVALFALAPLVPAVLGESYRESTDALRWLAALPLLQGVGYLAGDALSGADRQGLRCALQAGAAALNVGLNLLLIPAYSWKGAAWATLASLAILAAALWLAASVLERGEARGAPTDPLLGAARMP